GPHQAHTAELDVDQLRQLIELRAAQPEPEPRYPRIATRSNRGTLIRRTFDHGAKFPDAKAATAAADPLLAEQHRTRRGQRNGDADDQQQRRTDRQRDRRDRQVQPSFEDALVQGPRPGLGWSGERAHLRGLGRACLPAIARTALATRSTSSSRIDGKTGSEMRRSHSELATGKSPA